MNPDHELDQAATSLVPDQLPENHISPASEMPAAPAEAAVLPKRRGRPPGNGTTKKPGKAARGSAAKTTKPAGKLPNATTAAFAVLADLAGDDLAVAVHAASPAARAVIAQLLKAGI